MGNGVGERRPSTSPIWSECSAALKTVDAAVLIETAARAKNAAAPIHERRAVLVAERDAICRRLRHDVGLDRVSRITEWLCDRPIASAERLTAVEARTMAGVLAKASTFAMIQDKWQCYDPWVVELAESVARDILRIGGDA